MQMDFAKVLMAVREWGADPAIKMPISSWDAPRQVADFLALGDWYTSTEGWRDRERFDGQITRALAKLTGEGSLRKVKAGDRGPDGKTVRYGRYYTDARVPL